MSCAPNRWIRVPGNRSGIQSTGTGGVLRIPGTVTAPIQNVALRGLTLSPSDVTTIAGYKVVEASHAHGLRADDLIFNFSRMTATGSGTRTALYCTNCNGVDFKDLSSPGVTETLQYRLTLVDLVASSGAVARLRLGPTASAGVSLVRLSSASGPVSLTDLTTESLAGLTGGTGAEFNGGLFADNLPASSPLTLRGLQLVFPYLASSPFTSNLVHLKSVSAFTIDGVGTSLNLLDGSAVLETGTSSNMRRGIFLEDSAGTVSNTEIKLPTLATSGFAQLRGIEAIGSRGALKISKNKIGGGTGAGSDCFGISVEGVSTGLVEILGNAVAVPPYLGTNIGRGINLLNVAGIPGTAFIVADNRVTTATQANGTTVGIYLGNSSGRVERNSVVVGGAAYVSGLVVVGPSAALPAQVELYGNYLYGGSASSVTATSSGLEIGNYSRVIAIGNTFEGGGTTLNTASAGLYCLPSSTGIFESNLVSGGRAQNHRMAYGGGSTTTCFSSTASSFKNNYFFFAAGTGTVVNEATPAIQSNPNSSGNRVDSTSSSGCFDPNATSPDYKILSPSHCINAGNGATRLDGTAVTQDVELRARQLGSAPDIGAYELQ